MLAELVLAILIVALAAYAVLGGADFGAGFWDLTAGGPERGARMRGLINGSMGPVWEANHVWLIVVLVIMWTCFPTAFGAIMETLYVPLFLAGVGIIFRGAAFATRGEAATISEARAFGATFALASILTPFFLGCALGAIASGQVPAEGDPGIPLESWTNATSIFAGLMAISVGIYTAAVFLSGDAVRARMPDLAEAFRRRALGAAVVAGALSIAGLFVVNDDAPDLYDGLTSGLGLACVIIAVLIGVVTLWLIASRRYEIARFTSGLAVGAVLTGMAAAMSPDILPGELSLDDAAAGDATMIATLVALVLALLIIVPSIWLLFKLTLAGRLSERYSSVLPSGEQR
ncbi:MAG TPA: cytochrome d ubiquinol oxidase subunit II [Solirubrobacterales bacterium]|jgi:cytochrome d ubiquinol oxidase subunit II|nr:cytochrome d ubiquinol oxidase subunit II [Solirubrobacterales bacterium]